MPEKVIVGAVVKSIAAFLNSQGGTLDIGVDGHVLGIAPDLGLKKFDRDRSRVT